MAEGIERSMSGYRLIHQIRLTHHIKNWILIAIGSLSVMLGVLGIFLPVLPTTPFLLLAAACYIRSSDRFYKWLIANKWLGTYIKNYREGHGIPKRTKIWVISLLWLSIGFSAIFVVPALIGKVTLVAIAAGVTYHLVRVKTLEENPALSSGENRKCDA
jgi:uncharacterized membrane protein YbaN (DUF454 family)